MGFFTGLGYWTRGNLKCVYLQQKVDQKEYKRCGTISYIRKTQTFEKPFLHKDIERLVDGPYIEFLQDKRLEKIGTIGGMKYDIIDFSNIYSIIVLFVCLLLWMWNGENPN